MNKRQAKKKGKYGHFVIVESVLPNGDIIISRPRRKIKLMQRKLWRQGQRIVDNPHTDEEIARAKAYQDELNRIDSLPFQYEKFRDICKEAAARRYGFDQRRKQM